MLYSFVGIWLSDNFDPAILCRWLCPRLGIRRPHRWSMIPRMTPTSSNLLLQTLACSSSLCRSLQRHAEGNQRFCCDFGARYPGWWFQPLWKIWVNWDDYSQLNGKIKNVPNHQPVTSLWDLSLKASGVATRSRASLLSDIRAINGIAPVHSYLPTNMQPT